MTNRAGDLSGAEARTRLYELMRANYSLDELMDRVLDIGTSYLGVPHGHITHLDEEANRWEAIASTDPPDGPYPTGLTFELSKSYCRRTLRSERPIALHNAPEQGWADDIAFEENGLHCYHGARFTVDGEPYGTACFVAEDPRAEPFSEAEQTFTELLAQVLGQAFERDRFESELALREERLSQRERLNRVLNRVLRHNLRNDMNIVLGYAELLCTALEDEDRVQRANRITHIAHRLLDLSETARQLESYTNDPPAVEPTDLVPLVDACVDEVEAAYPNADITVAAPDEAMAYAARRVEVAVAELVENAAKHAGDSPTVDVSVEDAATETRVRVVDDGPGLPANERYVIDHGEETPVHHGKGLGLWFVYWLITELNGEVDATVSEAGTTISLRFPAPADCDSSSSAG